MIIAVLICTAGITAWLTHDIQQWLEQRDYNTHRED